MAALSDDEVLKSLAPDLKFLMDERELPPPIQVMVGRSGLKSVGLFSGVADTRADLRQLAVSEFKLDPREVGISDAAKAARYSSQARMVDLWETCRRRVEEVDRQQAESKAARLPVIVQKSEHIQLRMRYERAHGRVEDHNYPSSTLIEKRLQQIEENDLKADDLQDVTNSEEQLDQPVGAVLEGGRIKTAMKAKKVSMPSGPEELRQRLNLIGISFLLANTSMDTVLSYRLQLCKLSGTMQTMSSGSMGSRFRVARSLAVG